MIKQYCGAGLGSTFIGLVIVIVSRSFNYLRAARRGSHTTIMTSEELPGEGLTSSCLYALCVKCIHSLLLSLSLPTSCGRTCRGGCSVERNGGARWRGTRPHTLVVRFCATNTVPRRCERAYYLEIESMHSNEKVLLIAEIQRDCFLKETSDL